VEKFHNSPPVDPVVSITAPIVINAIKKTLVKPEINLGIFNKKRRTRLSLGVMAGFIAASLWSGQTFALPDNNGDDFILGFIPNYDNSASLEFHVTSNVATDVTIQYPVNSPSFNETVSVSPGVITTVVVPTSAQTWPSGSVANNAVHAFADKEFTLYMVNKRQYSSDAALGLPVDVLDTDHIVMSYSPSSEFLVVATEDNTTVTMVSSGSLDSHSEDTSVMTAPLEVGGISVSTELKSSVLLDFTPLDVTLNRGEGFLVTGGDLTGTRVHANKPVSVTNGNRCVNIGPGACDHIFQVAPPVSSWGTTALVADLPEHPNGTVYRILAAEDNTSVLQDGLLIATLNKGEFHDTGILSGNHQFQAEQPILVTAFMTGLSSGLGDPAMGNIVPPKQYSNRYTFSTVGGGQFSSHYLQVFADNTETDTITLDGSPIGASNFTAIGTSGYSVANLSLSEGSHTTASKLGHGVFVMGLNSYDSYLYAGGAQLGGIIVDNDAPVASDVSVSGRAVLGGTLTASYTYSDAEDDSEGETSIKWLLADDAQGTNKAVITGASNKTYTPTNTDLDKFISVEVTVVAKTGTMIGKSVESTLVGPVSEVVASPGKFEFTSKIYFANESSGHAIVKVARKGGSSGEASVNYATAAFEDRDTINPTNNPATEDEDYATTEGSLTWKDGETGIQTFEVPVFDDNDEEGDETVNLVLSSANGADLGDKNKITAKLRIADDECHGVYTTAARTLYHPLITVPVFDPISGQPTEDIQVFEGTFTLINGIEDFTISVTDTKQFSFVKQVKNVDKLEAACYAKYDWQTETFQIPYVDVPSIVVLPMGHSQVGPTQIFRAKMQQMPLSGFMREEDGEDLGSCKNKKDNKLRDTCFIFHVEGEPFKDQDRHITADPNASVHTSSKDEVEAQVDASIEIAPDEYTYYQYLYTYDK